MSADSRPVIVVGGGGHAKVLISNLRSAQRRIIGITDPGLDVGGEILGVPVLGDDEVIMQFKSSDIELVNGIGALPDYGLRWYLIEKMGGMGFRFSSVIHPSAIIDKSVVLGEGIQVMAGCVLQAGVEIGRDSVVNTGTIIEHDCKIGNQCCISPGVTINGEVTIGDDVFIGSGSIVLQGLNIAHGVIIGAGSLILQDIPQNTKFIQLRTNKIN